MYREKREILLVVFFVFVSLGVKRDVQIDILKKIKKLNDIWKDIRVSEGEKKGCETPIWREEKN